MPMCIFPDRELKLGEPVIFRDYNDEEWTPGHYGYYDKAGKRFVLFAGATAKQVKPLKGNEALVGRTGKTPDEPDYAPEQDQQFRFGSHMECFDEDAEQWVDALYIRHDEDRGNGRYPHFVLLIEKKDSVWVDDYCVRPKQEAGQ